MVTSTVQRASARPARRADRHVAARRRTPRRRLLVGTAAVAALAFAAVLAISADKPTEATLGGAAPTFQLTSTDGGTVSLADHTGHDVLLYSVKALAATRASTSRPGSKPSSSASTTSA